jgi:hypothetical protein
MCRLRLFTLTAVAVLSFSELSSADTPQWLPAKQETGVPTQSLLPVGSESPAPERLQPNDVFSSSADSLIRMSCSNAEGECCDGMNGAFASGHTPTWVKFTPYVWATAVTGDITVDGITAPMNIDLSDLWQMLTNGAVRGGFMGHLGFGRDNWTIFINGDIVSMNPSAQVRRATIDTGLTMTLLELGGAVDLFNANESDPANSPLRIQALGGVRYYAVDAAAIVSLPNVNPLIQIENGATWVDLFVGSQALAQITPTTDVFVRGDVGGFGIGSSSLHAWNLVSGVSTTGICGSKLFLGYRLFDVDQSLNGGTGSPLGFGVDQLIHGPVIGLTFQF